MNNCIYNNDTICTMKGFSTIKICRVDLYKKLCKFCLKILNLSEIGIKCL